jgi:DNA polymerase-4
MSQNFILHIDMNSYFASVEQQANPFLRGKSVGVCAYKSPRGCIIASSKEAKKKGVTTGMRVVDARVLCPEIILIENEPIKYRSTTNKIFSIFSDYTDKIEPYSIDEAFMDLSGYATTYAEAVSIGKEMQGRVLKEVGGWLTCSVGVSYTRWLAKFASDMAEKGSVNIITKYNLEDKLGEADLMDAWGINVRLAYRLQKLGISDLIELKHYHPQNLIQALGKTGYFLWANVNGISIEGVKYAEERKPKSIGHSYCLPKKTTDHSYLDPILMKLCTRTGRRLREKGLEAKGISMSWSYEQGGYVQKHKKIDDTIFETTMIYNYARNIFHETPLPDKIRMLAISVFGLRKISNQMSFFDDRLKKRAVSEAMDNINNIYGEQIVFHGAMWGTGKNALERIGFRKTLEPIWRGRNEIEYISDDV